MYQLNIYPFHELSTDAQAKAAAKLAAHLYEQIRAVGFGKLVQRKNTIARLIGFVKEIALTQYLEDGTPALLPIHSPKPIPKLSDVLNK